MTRSLSMTGTLTLLIGLTLLVGQPAPGATLPAAPGYVITDLGSLGGGQTVPVAINAAGAVAGSSATAAGQIHAFLLPPGGSMQDLGTMGGAAGYVTGLNNRGDVAGYAATAAGQTRAAVLIDGQMIDLGLAGGITSKALGINDMRQVLVVSTDSEGYDHSLLWQNGRTTLPPTLGGNSTSGGALNNLGQVVGNAAAADGTNHAFGYDPSAHQLIDLGDIGPKGILSHVNEIGQAVGTRTNARGYRIAFGADLGAANSLADKTAHVGLSGTVALGINNEGTAVGVGELRTAPGMNAGLWTPDNQWMNLNQALAPNSGWVLLSATAVNDAGIIVGTALSPSGSVTAYLLAVPGPALSADKAAAIAGSLDPAIAALQKDSDAAATAAAPSTLATGLADLQQARLLLTPSAGQNTVGGVASGQASHLLSSTGNLLQAVAGNSPFLSSADRDAAEAAITAAQKDLQ